MDTLQFLLDTAFGQSVTDRAPQGLMSSRSNANEP